MIVRDNARTLAACLESIRPWTDELVVVDTGSQDETPQIAEAFGARLGQFPWIDDFAAARNVSLGLANGEWLFWMDSDDTIDSENGRRLRELATANHEPRVLGYIIQVHCPAAASDGIDLTIVDHVKLIRNRPQIRFEGRIHEQILPSIRSLGGEVRWTDLFVVHSGADHSAEGRRRKVDRDLRLLQLDIEERPGHPFVLFNLGMTYADIGEFGVAAEWLEKSLAASSQNESHLRKTYALLVNCLMQLGREGIAIERCRTGLAQFPLDPELRFRWGMLAHNVGDLDDAIRTYRSILDIQDNRHFTSIDPGILGHKTRHNLSLAYSDRGDFDLAETQWRSVVRESPAHRAGWRGLGQALIDQRKSASLGVLIDTLLKQGESADASWLQAEKALIEGDARVAKHLLLETLAVNKGHLQARRALCRLLFDQGSLAEAEEAMWELIKYAPEDGAAEHNLGLIYLQLNRTGDAIAAFERSLKRRPNWPVTLAALDDATTRSNASAVSSTAVSACNARRSLQGNNENYRCLHPHVHAPNHVVSQIICSLCSTKSVPMESLRPAGAPIRNRQCVHLGDQIGTQPCGDCAGAVKIKIFKCEHPEHSETTLAECEKCPDGNFESVPS